MLVYSDNYEEKDRPEMIEILTEFRKNGAI